MAQWFLDGENGADFGAIRVPVLRMGMTTGTLIRRSAAVDELSYSLSIRPPATPEFLPQKEQAISVWCDDVCLFRGYAQAPRYNWSNGVVKYAVTATGGWRELERIPLAPQDITYTRPQGDLRATMLDILRIAIAGGARFSVGVVDAMFAVIPLSFRGMSCAAGLEDCLRFVADAVVYFDYAPAVPVIHIRRRSNMPTRTYALGQDYVRDLSVLPDETTVPDRVAIGYATADANGIVTAGTLVAGAVAQAQSQRGQAITTVDSSFDQFQEQAISGEVNLSTTPTGSVAWQTILDLDPALAKYCEDNSVPAFSRGPTTYSDQTSTMPPLTVFSLTLLGPTYTYGAGPTAGYIVTDGEVTEWMISRLGIAKNSPLLRCDFYLVGTKLAAPSWYASLPIQNKFFHSGIDSGGAAKNIVWVEFNQPVLCVNKNCSGGVAYRDPGTYTTLAPPTDLASQILFAQSKTNYTGSIDFNRQQTPDFAVSHVINVAGADSTLATMAALVRQQDFDLLTQEHKLALGAPARTSAESLMSRFRRL